MKLNFFFLLFLFPAFTGAQNQIAIKNISIVDIKTGKVSKGQTVIIEENKIIIGKKKNQTKSATVIDGTGKYLIPGLWDMHAHTLTDKRYEYAFPLMIANGVTGVREMGSNLAIEEVNKIIQDIASGNLTGPRFGSFTYKILDGPGTQLGVAIAVATPEEGRQWVRTYKQKGAGFIKPYNLLGRDVYLAIADEAKKQNIPIEGHIPFSMSASEVSDLGQIVVEHNFGVLLSCSSNEEELRKQSQAKTVPWLQIEGKAADSYNSEKAKRLFEQFARNGTWSCPTISFQRLYPLDSNNSAGIASQYIRKSQLASWQTGYDRMMNNALPQYRKLRYDMLRKIIVDMHHAGVGILAGTDMGAFFSFPGFSLHDELQELVAAGLTPLEALQTATLNPAKFLHKEKDLGVVEHGKIADLVILDANPLKDISNTKKIYAVIVNGKLFARSELDGMLNAVKAIVKE